MTPYFNLLMTLWPRDWKEQLSNLNNQISILAGKNEKQQEKNRPIKFVTEHEFWVLIGILISAAATGKGGKGIYNTTEKILKDGKHFILQCVDYSLFMTKKMFEVLKPLFHYCFVHYTIHISQSSV
jgi:hypothetical protein